jgi:hypothetical protein
MSGLTKLPALAAAACLGLMSLTASAHAWGWDPTRAPEQPAYERFINHYIYKPRYTHVYHTAPQGDPYAYRYAKRAYYPYYGSRYWVSADNMRNRYRYHYEGPKYVYQPSWGRPKGDGHHEHHAPSRPSK